jgi:hypothetical protein
MKLGEVQNAYEALSGKASDIIRQLSLAGIGLIWLFKTSLGTSEQLDPRLLRGTFFIFLALTFDLLQYLIGTATWHIYFRKKEREQTTEEEKFEAPEWINWPTWTLFWMKSTAMVIAYAIFILPFLICRFIQ